MTLMWIHNKSTSNLPQAQTITLRDLTNWVIFLRILQSIIVKIKVIEEIIIKTKIFMN